ncbi:MAG TPA: CBS domain-containing protein [Polyangia bacterium]|nr:CBS domain-containing protein [Polyangia bacterium]
MTGKNNRRGTGQSNNQSTRSPNESTSGGYGRPLGPGGGFGAGGYGSYGTQGASEQPGGGGYTDGTWGNEQNGGPRETRNDVGSDVSRSGGHGSMTSEEMAASRMDEEGGGSRPAEENTQRQRGGQNRVSDQATRRNQSEPDRWQRQAITAAEIMTRDVETVTPDSSLQEVAALMKSANCGIVPVVDANQTLVGLVTDRDIVVRACAAGLSPAQTRAKDVMTADIEAVTEDEDIKDVVDLMGQKQIRRIPVVDRNDRLVGIISMADVANRADNEEDLGEALERVSAKHHRRE